MCFHITYKVNKTLMFKPVLQAHSSSEKLKTKIKGQVLQTQREFHIVTSQFTDYALKTLPHSGDP